MKMELQEICWAAVAKIHLASRARSSGELL